MNTLWQLLIVLLAIVCATSAYWTGRKLGIREGRVRTLDQLRRELDNTIAEWEKQSNDVARAMELPGLAAVRRMLGARLL